MPAARFCKPKQLNASFDYLQSKENVSGSIYFHFFHESSVVIDTGGATSCQLDQHIGG